MPHRTFVFALLMLSAVGGVAVAAEERLNVVFILADDLGWG